MNIQLPTTFIIWYNTAIVVYNKSNMMIINITIMCKYNVLGMNEMNELI